MLKQAFTQRNDGGRLFQAAADSRQVVVQALRASQDVADLKEGGQDNLPLQLQRRKLLAGVLRKPEFIGLAYESDTSGQPEIYVRRLDEPGSTDIVSQSRPCRLLDISYLYIMTARFTRLVPLAVIATIPVLFAAQNSAPREIVLNHVSVIDMTGRPIQRDMAVLLRGDRIAAIERAAGFNVPGARVLDLTGKFLIPGLVDMHHHLDTGAAMPGLPVAGQERAGDVRANLKGMLDWGFTTVFSTSHMNVDLREFAELRRAAVDDPALPRYFGVGRAISVASGHASQPRFASYLPASADEARLNVREMHAIGVDAIKLVYADQAHTGRPPLPMMQPEVMRAIIDEAHRLSLKAYVHAPALRPAKDVLRAGADGLVHSVTDAPLDDEFIALMKKNRATYTSTLSLYTAFSDIAGWTRRLAAMDTRGRVPKDIYARFSSPEGAKAYHAVVGTFPPDNLRHAAANVRRAVEAGIPVLAGTDTGMPGVLLGISSQMELVLLVEAGLTTEQALAAATINPARALGRGNEQGTIERGRLADLLVLDADPLADIHNIGKVHLVFKGGTPNN